MLFANLRPVVWKLPLAALALGSLAAMVAQSVAPELTLGTALLWALAGAVALFVLLLLWSVMLVGAVALFVLLVLWSVILATIAQLILKHGGTDPQWFWFNGEPRGLRQLRGARRRGDQGLPTDDGGS
jgi:hypothetical protein